MNRRSFLQQSVAGVAGAMGMSALAQGAETSKPNIVFILVDDLGWADVGCFGRTFYETPNIDALAGGGMKFTDAYAACPVCSPTRASIMTGKYPARLHLTNFLKGKRVRKGSPILPADYVDGLALDEVTLPEALKTVGYKTIHLGKWHLGGEGFEPEAQGFDVNVGGHHSGMPKSFFWPQWGNNPPLVGRADGEYLPDRLSQDACTFIREHKDAPFFMYLSHYSVHIPLQAKAEKIKKYRKKLEEHPPKPGEQNNPVYAAMVESIDESVGRVTQTLEECGIADNTIVVFFSDNGGLSVKEGAHTPATTNAPLRGGKGHLYEGGIRESCIVRWPGVTKPGSVSSTVITSVDFMPTLCAAAGVEAEGHESTGPIDGIDITSTLKSPEQGLDREAIYWHYPHFANQGGDPGAAVRMGDWKLIERYEDDSLELYNLREDLGETRNLAEAQPKRARVLLAKLQEWRASVKANMPLPNPAYGKPE